MPPLWLHISGARHMTFVSFAQNFEDVMLWRALRHVERGFYVDVGAQHPDIDSVTRAFYERGWNGINIEPVASAHRRLAASRPRDINLNVALGATAGRANFFVLEGTGLSTLDKDTADTMQRQAFARSTVTVEVETLARVLHRHAREFARGQVHFLKIDVEGAERGVLAGADFVRTRPWIVLVEATAPLSTAETHEAWEPILLEAGYRFVWFDGLNRFYVAEERHEEMAQHFRVPVNVFDDVLRAADTEWARRIHEAEIELRALHEQLTAADERARLDSSALIETRQKLAEQRDLANQIDTIKRALEAAERRAQSSESRALDVERHAHEAEIWLAAMRSSTSWRITEPLRKVAKMSNLLRRQARRMVGTAAPRSITLEAPAFYPSLAAPLTFLPPAAIPPRIQGERRAVHQFHPGSAVGDAITNSMLLVRRLLREMGYASEIFVEQPPAALSGELLNWSGLPEHDDYVLIVRVSLGYAAFDRIAALPAPKVLMYHNITPAELLEGAPMLQDFARLGRAQLPHWRSHVAAALADSAINAMELRAAGFDAPLVCPLLFDIDAMRSTVLPDRPASIDQPFTILFVGRVVASKGQDALIDAFASFARSYIAPCRLVLVGHLPHEDDAYLKRLRAKIDVAGLRSKITLTGLVTDEQRSTFYAQADLYVSLSQHEGFGVPLIEAMVAGVPVLAWPCAAVPYTMGGAGELLQSREPATVAAQMLALARDPQRRQTMSRRQREQLDRFSLKNHVPLLVQALARAGAALPPQIETRRLLDQQLFFTITGHINGAYSLAAVNRTNALALAAQRPGRVRVAPVEGLATIDISGVPADERAAITTLVGQARPASGPEIVISQHYPVLVPTDPGDAAIAMFAWEESRVPDATIRVLNQSFRAVMVPSCYVAKVLVDSGLRRPVHVIGHAPKLDGYRAIGEARRHAPPRSGPVTFLHVSTGLARKGIDLLLSAFARAFRLGDPVRLIIKTTPNPQNGATQLLETLRKSDAKAPEIILINEERSEAELLALYRDADVMVLPTRGEGFNLPALEAMAAGLPVIVTGHGGHLDFCTKHTARLLDYRLTPSESHVAAYGALWAEPKESDLVAALREHVVPLGAVREAIRARVQTAAAEAGQNRDPASLARRIETIALDLVASPPPTPPRIAFVTTWDVRCGIAQYSRDLLSGFTPTDMAGLTVITDQRCPSTVWDTPWGEPVPVRKGWQLGESAPDLTLVRAIAAADPDVVVIQHQPMLLAWERLARVIQAPELAHRAICVTLHNTRHLAEEAEGRDAAIAALGRCARVVVHTLADVNRLKSLGLVTNVTLMPHGAPISATSPTRGTAPRLLPRESDPVIGCYGFFLPHKGIAELISATALLRAIWPRLRLRLVNAEYDSQDSRAEVAACRNAASWAGLAGAIDWRTGFLPPDESRDLLAGCDLVVLPYQETKESASGALRLALSSLVPVAVTPLPIFDDASETVARLAGTTPLEIAKGIETLLANPQRRAGLQDTTKAWLAENAWPVVAERFQGMLVGLKN